MLLTSFLDNVNSANLARKLPSTVETGCCHINAANLHQINFSSVKFNRQVKCSLSANLSVNSSLFINSPNFHRICVSACVQTSHIISFLQKGKEISHATCCSCFRILFLWDVGLILGSNWLLYSWEWLE